MAAAVACAVGAGSLVLGVAGTASADTAKVLPITAVSGIAVDGVHQQVFLSDPGAGEIVVTDYSGTVEKTLTGLSGVTGLALNADSSVLYAAVKGSDQIAAVDTATDTVATTYSLDGADAPVSVDVVGGIVWFGYNGDLGSLDVSGASPVVTLGQAGAGTGLTAGSELASSPTAPGVLVVGSADVLAVYHVSAQGAVRQALGSMENDPSQIALTPDGSTVLTSWGSSGYSLGEYSATDLRVTGSYPIDPYPNAVAVAPDGTVAGGSFSWYAPSVHMFRPGAGAPYREYDFPNTGSSSGADTLLPGILAWAPDESRLFAVSQNDAGVLTLRSLSDPTKEQPTLTVTAPAKATRAASLTVTGKLTSPSAVPAGVSLAVTRTDLDNPTGKALAAVTVGAGGAFSFKDTPPAGGTVTYTVSYAGDTTHSAASGSATVAVSRTTPVLTVTNSGKAVNYGTKVTYTVHLGSEYRNRTVSLYGTPYGEGRQLLKAGAVNSSGNLSVSVTMYRNWTFSAVYAGDDRTAPSTVTTRTYAYTRVAEALSNEYRTARIGSISYAYYHKNTDVIVTAYMPYSKGRQVYLQVQQFYQGAWRTIDGGYVPLGSRGSVRVNLGASGYSGIEVRVRSVYYDGGSGDDYNASTSTGWDYLYFTN